MTSRTSATVNASEAKQSTPTANADGLSAQDEERFRADRFFADGLFATAFLGAAFLLAAFFAAAFVAGAFDFRDLGRLRSAARWAAPSAERAQTASSSESSNNRAGSCQYEFTVTVLARV